eukprot:2925923-Prymnesium_polylepis.1
MTRHGILAHTQTTFLQHAPCRAQTHPTASPPRPPPSLAVRLALPPSAGAAEQPGTPPHKPRRAATTACALHAACRQVVDGGLGPLSATAKRLPPPGGWWQCTCNKLSECRGGPSESAVHAVRPQATASAPPPDVSDAINAAIALSTKA